MTTSHLKIAASALSCLPLLLAGCGEFAYKRGAGAADLERARQECRQRDSTPGAMDRCMQAGGWHVQKLDAFDSPFIEPAPAAPGQAAAATTAAPGSPTATPAPAAAANDNDRLLVSSWWKAGAGPDALKTGLKECSSRLDAAHQPEASQKGMTVTRALLRCMREQGWHAVQAR